MIARLRAARDELRRCIDELDSVVSECRHEREETAKLLEEVERSLRGESVN